MHNSFDFEAETEAIRQEILINKVRTKGRRNAISAADEKSFTGLRERITSTIRLSILSRKPKRDELGEWSDQEILRIVKARAKGRRPAISEGYADIIHRRPNYLVSLDSIVNEVEHNLVNNIYLAIAEHEHFAIAEREHKALSKESSFRNSANSFLDITGEGKEACSHYPGDTVTNESADLKCDFCRPCEAWKEQTIRKQNNSRKMSKALAVEIRDHTEHSQISVVGKKLAAESDDHQGVCELPSKRQPPTSHVNNSAGVDREDCYVAVVSHSTYRRRAITISEFSNFRSAASTAPSSLHSTPHVETQAPSLTVETSDTEITSDELFKPCPEKEDIAHTKTRNRGYSDMTAHQRRAATFGEYFDICQAAWVKHKADHGFCELKDATSDHNITGFIKNSKNVLFQSTSKLFFSSETKQQVRTGINGLNVSLSRSTYRRRATTFSDYSSVCLPHWAMNKIDLNIS